MEPHLPPPPEPPRSPGTGLTPELSIVAGIGIYFAAQILAGILVLLYPLSQGWSETELNDWLNTSTAAQFLIILIFEILTIAFVLLILKWRHVARSAIGLVKPKLFDLVRALAGFAVYFPIYMITYQVMQKVLPQINYDQKQQLGFETATGTGPLLLVFFGLVVLPPIAEEIAVRGLVFTGLRKRMPFLVSAFFASILFAIAHLQIGSGQPLLWTAAVDTFILSLVLCFLREKTKSLWPGIFLHAIKNGLAFAVLFGTR